MDVMMDKYVQLIVVTRARDRPSEELPNDLLTMHSK